MNINNELEDKLLKQPFAEEADRDADYRLTAARYAKIENGCFKSLSSNSLLMFIRHFGYKSVLYEYFLLTTFAKIKH